MTASPPRGLRVGGPWFWAILLLVLIPDVLTKRWAVEALVPRHVPHPVVGDLLRFTLSYNPGAAFGMSVGQYSRVFFTVVALAVMGVMLQVTRDLVQTSRAAAIGLPLVLGGAIGNLIDRLTRTEGVVDFIDIGVGSVRFWTFNVADMGVTFGAIGVLWALWRADASHGDRGEAGSPRDAGARGPGSPGTGDA
jgi:signal peptidase II